MSRSTAGYAIVPPDVVFRNCRSPQSGIVVENINPIRMIGRWLQHNYANQNISKAISYQMSQAGSRHESLARQPVTGPVQRQP